MFEMFGLLCKSGMDVHAILRWVYGDLFVCGVVQQVIFIVTLECLRL